MRYQRSLSDISRIYEREVPVVLAVVPSLS